MDLNKVMLIGRLVRDPELRSLPSGRSVATFSVATGRTWVDQQGQKQKQSEFHNIVMWGKIGETAHQYLHKASRIYIEGRLQTREWTGQDGVKKYRTEIVAENMIMLDGKPGTGMPETSFGGGEQSLNSFSAGATNPQEVIEEEIKVEDIPF